MKHRTRLQSITIAALLSALGIVIAMFFPKIPIPPASFTLAIQVPIFIAMFISPPVAAAVALVSATGFFFIGLPVTIVLRALSHIVFALVGSMILKKNPGVLATPGKATGFGLMIAVLHAACEVAAVTLFYAATSPSLLHFTNGFGYSVLLLVGLGSVAHSMVDFGIAIFIWKPLLRVVQIPVSAKIMPKRNKTENAGVKN